MNIGSIIEILWMCYDPPTAYKIFAWLNKYYNKMLTDNYDIINNGVNL